MQETEYTDLCYPLNGGSHIKNSVVYLPIFSRCYKFVVRVGNCMSTVPDPPSINSSLNSQVISYGRILVDTDSCQVTYEGKIITLLPKEYKLLLLFLKYPNHVLSYEVIIDKLWEMDKTPTQSSIRSHIKGLRRAFKKIDDSAKIIENVHGLGYRLQPLNKEKSTPSIISPSLAVMKDLLQAKALEYLVINDKFIIQYLSPGLPDYCDYPELLQVGVKVENAFPELVGLEGIFKKILDQKCHQFDVKSIARAANPNRPEYINLYVIREELKPSDTSLDQLLFIFFEDASEQMFYNQRVVQLENEWYLRLEIEKGNNSSSTFKVLTPKKLQALTTLPCMSAAAPESTGISILGLS